MIREIEILVPPGPRGQVGFQIGQAGNQVFPTEPGAFVVTDNEIIHWPIEEANTSGAWQLIGYNTGTFPHTLQIRFLVEAPSAPGPPELVITPGDMLGPQAPASDLTAGQDLEPPPELPGPP